MGRHNSRQNRWRKRSVFREGNGPVFGPFCSSRLTFLLKRVLCMIRFSAEAIFASSTSKSGIRIPLTEQEDLRSSTDSTISTSLIHSIASVGNCEQVHTSVLNLIFQQANVADVGEFVKMRIWNLQSLLVCPIILWKSSLTRDEWISGWRSWLASLIPSGCLALTHHMWWCVFWHIRNPRIGLLRMRCWRRRRWICKNVSRKTMRIPNIWRLIVAA